MKELDLIPVSIGLFVRVYHYGKLSLIRSEDAGAYLQSRAQGAYQDSSAKADSKKQATCPLGCSLPVPAHTGFGKKGSHGHMVQHATRMLGLVENGAITKPDRPAVPTISVMPVAPCRRPCSPGRPPPGKGGPGLVCSVLAVISKLRSAQVHGPRGTLQVRKRHPGAWWLQSGFRHAKWHLRLSHYKRISEKPAQSAKLRCRTPISRTWGT